MPNSAECRHVDIPGISLVYKSTLAGDETIFPAAHVLYLLWLDRQTRRFTWKR